MTIVNQDAGSIRSVAAALVETRSTPPTAATPEGQGPEGTDQQAVSPTGDEDEDHLELAGTETEGFEAPEGGDAGTDGGDDDENQVFRLTVAGEDRDVSLAELIKSYSGEGAIAKRLQEATEIRNEAARARDIAVEQERSAARETIQRETEALRTQAQQLAAVYQHYGAAILQPQVQMPDPSLQRTDPIGYLTGVEAYRQDQERLRAQQSHMQEVVQQAEALEVQKRSEFAAAEVQRMVQEVPAMANPQYRKAQAERVFSIARAVGFSEAEVRQYATDRRVIYLAMLAAQGAETIMGTRSGGKPTVTVKPTPPKAKTPTTRAANGTFQKKAQASVERAKTTGDYRDVAKTLVVSRTGAPRH
jgi:hypothetical protein